MNGLLISYKMKYVILGYGSNVIIYIATMMEFENKLTDGKLKTRGYFKALVFAFTSAIMINFGRIYRYMMDKYKKEGTLMSKIDFSLKFQEIITRFLENLFVSKKFRAAFNIG